MKKILLSLILISLFALPAIGLAQQSGNSIAVSPYEPSPGLSWLPQGFGGGGAGSPSHLQDVDVVQVIRNIINWIFWFLIMFSVIMFLFAGFQYVTASGDADKIKTANKNVLYALVGVAIAFGAKGIVALIGAVTGQNVGF